MQRLEYEHGTSCITTIPSVPYKAKLKGEKLIKDMRTDEITIVNPENVSCGLEDMCALRADERTVLNRKLHNPQIIQLKE